MILLLALGMLSCAFAFAVQISTYFQLPHRQRLTLIRASLISLGAVALASILLRPWQMSAAGSLLPTFAVVGVAKAKAGFVVWQDGGFHWGRVLLGVYALTVCLMFLRLMVTYFTAKKLLRGASAVRLGGHWVYAGPNVPCPFSFGIFAPKIFVPHDFLQRNSAAAIDIVLEHENIHVENGDPQWKIISHVTHALLFFSPGIHYLHRRFELEMELECDRLTRERTGTSVQTYGAVLIEVAAGLSGFAPNSMFAYVTESNLKRRILAMKARNACRPVLYFCLGAAMLAAGVSAAAAASGVVKTVSQYKVKADFYVGGKLVSSPRFTVLADEPASLVMKRLNPDRDFRMMLTATDDSAEVVPDGIHLKMAVDYKGEGRSIRANPQVVVKPGEEAVVILTADLESPVEFRIVAERQ